jgi:hypothetical protein
VKLTHYLPLGKLFVKTRATATLHRYRLAIDSDDLAVVDRQKFTDWVNSMMIEGATS